MTRSRSTLARIECFAADRRVRAFQTDCATRLRLNTQPELSRDRKKSDPTLRRQAPLSLGFWRSDFHVGRDDFKSKLFVLSGNLGERLRRNLQQEAQHMRQMVTGRANPTTQVNSNRTRGEPGATREPTSSPSSRIVATNLMGRERSQRGIAGVV